MRSKLAPILLTTLIGLVLVIQIPQTNATTLPDKYSVQANVGCVSEYLYLPSVFSDQANLLFTNNNNAMTATGSSQVVYADFNCDGYADLAIGVPGENVAGLDNAGAVNVLYGSAIGLTAESSQIWTQNSPDVESVAEPGDFFGGALTTADFNGDGYADLAVGVPGEDINDLNSAGAVNVLYGSTIGLTAVNNQIWSQHYPDAEGTPEAGDQFGDSLTAADFNGDGFADLAVGVRHDSVDGDVQAGAVNVLYGSSAGLTVENDQIWSQDSPNVQGASEVGDFFGEALTTADFNGDGFVDLAIGSPLENLENDLLDAGVVNILYGSSAGLTAENNQLWAQDSPDIGGAIGQFDEFGRELTAADFNNDGFADLAVGVPNENYDAGKGYAGAVNILYGSSGGLIAENNQIWTQDSPNVEGVVEIFDHFGSAVAAADFNGDGFADLAIGVQGQDVEGLNEAGAVNVLYGSSVGLTAENDQIWTQNSPDVEDVAESGDNLGNPLTAADFNGDGIADLVIGVPDESIGNFTEEGAVNVLYGTSIGLTAINDQIWTQGSLGVPGDPEANDYFGFALMGSNTD